jgi:uncharacterized protein
MNTVAGLWRYPVKSIGGEQLTRTHLGALGVTGDRAWGLRDITAGKVISSKSPAMGRVLLNFAAAFGAELDPDSPLPSATVSIDGNDVSTDNVDQLSEIMTNRLGRLVRFERATAADEVYESYWPEIPGLALSDVTTDFPIAMFTNKGSFVDLAALHVVSTGALRRLQALLPKSAIDIRRFRPNIVIDSEVDDFVDNSWAGKTATLGSATIAFSLSAPRCVMTTLEQGGLPPDRSILQTLATHNRVEFEGFGNFACLGVYAEVVTPGVVNVGDELVFTS